MLRRTLGGDPRIRGRAVSIAPRTIGAGPRTAVALIGVLLIAVNLRAALTAVGPVLGLVRGDLHLSAAAAGLLTGLPLLAFAAFSPLAPAVARAVGLDRSLWLALLLTAAGIVVRSLPWGGGPWLGTAALGVGIALVNVLLPSLVKRDFPDRVAQVTGVYSAVQSTVAALAAGVVVPIADASSSWRIALGVWAGMALIALAVLAPRLRARAVPATVASSTRTGRSPWRSALGWQVTLFMGLQSIPYFVLIAWLPSILESRGVTAEAAGWDLFLLQIVSVVGNLATAAVAHRVRDQRVVGLTGGLLCVTAFAGLLLLPQADLVWTIAGGLGCGSTIVLALSLFSLRTRTPDQAAALSGMAQSVGYLLAAGAPAAFGLLHDASGAWNLPLGLAASLMVATSVFGVLAARDRLLA
ncbi:MFS transporter [Amnibacterium sp.]|uniref:MFS transporter n=1 Tax=Amnibacterium sp. TaxID=1872496 RepID=UPI0026354909|nr:MFS transporter [Amnibacterium sp.]